jgi:hypothetical protein
MAGRNNYHFCTFRRLGAQCWIPRELPFEPVGSR